MPLSVILRWFLVIAALISLITSIGFLSVFSIPHSPDLPEVPSWQNIGPQIISALYDNEDDIAVIDFQEDQEGDSLQLLLSVSTMIGSLGYEKATFYMAIAPYWNILLSLTSLFTLSMILTSVVMLFYLLLSLRLKDRFFIVPWIFLHVLLDIVLLSIVVILLIDVGNTARTDLEIKSGTSGNYIMAVSVFVLATVYVSICITVASKHVVEQVQLMDTQIGMAKNILRINQRV